MDRSSSRASTTGSTRSKGCQSRSSGRIRPSISAAAVRRKLRWVREAAEEASRASELNILIFVLEVTDDRRGAAERYTAEFPGLTAEDILASPHALIGTPDQIAEDLRQRRAEYGLSYIVINTGVDEHVEQFAPIVSVLAGE